jgi:hypothetical protein
MNDSQRFPFVNSQDSLGVVDSLPKLPIELKYQDRSVSGLGLLDTGSSVNVLPYQMGLSLGLVWENSTMAVTLGGNLATAEARGVLVNAIVGDFEPVRLVFAWCESNDVPLLLGRMNFFSEFNVCFYQSQLMFEVRRT